MMTVVTTANVFRNFLPVYTANHRLSPQQAKVLTNIDSCRTEMLGGRILACNHCGYSSEQFHSCRNRHCPQCQKSASDDWLERRREDILPVPYFHLVFTLPHTLNGWVQLHPEVIYPILFQAVSTTLKQFGRDRRRLDGEIGMTLVLHTWGQNLSQHVHIHCLIPGGALSEDGESWHPARSTYLFPVRALSRCYRGHMVRLLRKAWRQRTLSRICDPQEVDERLDHVMKKSWVVFAKPTQTHTDTVLTYLARYTYRIAISDNRLMDMDTSHVFFRWKNYRQDGAQQTMSLTGVEFIRRWLLHVLPQGMMCIRHYGFLANCHRRRKLALIRRCLEVDCDLETAFSKATSDGGNDNPVLGRRCPKCEKPVLSVVAEIEPRRRRQ